MAHHFVIITFNENVKEIPYKYLVELSKLVDFEVNMTVDETGIQFRHYGYFWDYEGAIDDLFADNKVTENTLAAYAWLKQNTTVESDCWNVNDNDYGPWNWEDFERQIQHIKKRYLEKE